MNTICNDCRYYLPVDVFSGLCKVSKLTIKPEEKSCNRYQLMPKCKFCAHYRETKENLGLCMKKADAYPDMISITCEDFSEIKKSDKR